MKELLKYILKGVETDAQLLVSLLGFAGMLLIFPALTLTATSSFYAFLLAILLEFEMAGPFMKLFKWLEKKEEESEKNEENE